MDNYDKALSDANPVMATSALTVAGFLYFQYAAGVEPCHLCYYERWPYYFAAAAVASLIVARKRLRSLALYRLCLGLTAAGFAGGFLVACYHFGMEQHWWGAGAACSTDAISVKSLADLREKLATARVVACDRPAVFLMGLSLAGWDCAVASACSALALACIRRSRARGAAPTLSAASP